MEADNEQQAPEEQQATEEEHAAHLSVSLTALAEKCLQIQAQQQGMSLPQYAQFILEQQSRIMDPYALRQLPRADRNRLMAQQAEEAAPLYEADLALPAEERELTAFTALNGDPIYDYTP